MATGLTIVYALLVAAHLASCVVDARTLHLVTKPLLMPALLALCLASGRDVPVSVILALVLATIGDAALLSSKTRWFVVGGASFLACHLAYSWTFAADIDLARLPPPVWLLVVVYLGAGLALYRTVRANLGQMRPPTVAYLTVLGAMSFSALARFACVGSTPALVVFLGSVLFLASDYLLIFNANKRPIRHADLFVMATYIAAQTMIVVGYLAG